ncbi:MAG: TonB-dependent receptor [Gemmatimonadales bacterium]
MLWVLAGAACGGPLSLAAQIPDTTIADTLLTDSLRRGPDQTQKLLDAQALELVRVPVAPHLGERGPAPPLTRIILDRDSIDWHNAETLGDLLQAQPGVYLWRSGWIGHPEYADYQGRGASSVRYILDGVPYLPLGPDSTGVNPGIFPLSLLDRVEIERWPGRLVVRMYTRNYDRLAPRSRILVAAGDRKFARFGGALERRYSSGAGFTLAADYLNAPTRSGEGTDAQQLSFLAQGSYIPSDQAGLQYQVIRTSPDYSSWQNTIPGDTLGAGLNGDRTDAQFRGFLRRGPEGDGAQLDLVMGSSRWSGTGVAQDVGLLAMNGALQRPTWRINAGASAWSRWTPFEGRIEGGWTPLAGMAVSGEAVHQGHSGARQSDWIGVQAGVTLPLAVQLNGSLREGSEVATPTILIDQAQQLHDWRLSASWQRPLLGVEAAYVHTAAFRPMAFQPYLQVRSLAPIGAAEWLEVSARLSPRPWLLVEARYGDPQRVTADGIPPTHSIITGTIRSKFLRQYRSGIFDLKLQAAMESWGRGVIGRDSVGSAMVLPGATYFRVQVELKLSRFILYYDRMNLRGTQLGYVPGFIIPTGGQSFGVRWEFVN